MTMGAIQARVFREIERMQDEIVKTTQELVRIPSVVGDEARAQAYIESLYGTIGLDVTRFQAEIEKVRRHSAFIDTGMSYANRPNIIGELAGEADSPSLILNGHVDVVSPEPLQDWTYDPWGAEIKSDKLYGRGAGDMKAGLLANFFALKAILKAGIRPKGKVILQSVIDEEAGGAGGTLACLMEGYTADAIICTEPHNLNVTISHAGINYFRVSVKGRTSHAGLAHLGVNAVGKIIPIYQVLIALDEKRGREIIFPLYEEGSGRSCHINIGTLKAGDWPSTVAGKAVMECRIGYIPGENMADIKAMIESTIRDVADKDPWLRDNPPQIEWFGWQTEPWYQDPDHTFVRTVKDAAKSVLGHEANLIGRAGGIDSRFSQYFDMAATCTGPIAANIHGIDEHVEISSIFQITKILAMTVLKWCGYHEA